MDNYIDQLKAENERLRKDRDFTKYADRTDNLISEMDAEIRRLSRALWLARSERAIEKIAYFKLWNSSISTMNPEDGARQEYDKWKKNLGKFLSKAEKYR